MPKVSVIIPVYNVEKYLGECFDSVLGQTLKDIEVICLNDGSTDSSLSIMQKYAQIDSRVRVIDKVNEGVGITRNRGIKAAFGDYVAFIDPDDMYPAEDVLEILYNNAIKNNVLICGGEFATFTNRDYTLRQNFGKNFQGYIFPQEGIIDYKDYQFDYGYHRFIYKRKFLVDNNIFYPNYKRFQDPPFFVNAMIKAGKFYGIPKISYSYRRGHQKIKWNKEKTKDLFKGILDNMKYARDYNLKKLGNYSYCRFKEHYNQVADYIDFSLFKLMFKMCQYNSHILAFCFKTLLRKVFSCKESDVHYVISIVGIKIKIKSNKLVELNRYKELNIKLDYILQQIESINKELKNKKEYSVNAA